MACPKNSRTSPSRRILIWRHKASRGVRKISGVVKSASFASCALEYRWKQYPSRTRPARPRRCLLLARLHHAVTRLDMRLAGSYWVSRTRPPSMTKTTSSMVIEVSAMFVAMTTLRTPGGGLLKVRRCSSEDSVECSGMSMNRFSASSSDDARRSCRPRISAMPGRNIKIAPSSYSSAMSCTSISMSSMLIFSSSTVCRHLSVLSPYPGYKALVSSVISPISAVEAKES